MTKARAKKADRERADRYKRLNREVPKLMGVTQVAEALNVKTSNVDRVAGLPPAAQRVAGGRLWRSDVIREFARRRRNNARPGTRAAGVAAKG